VLVDHVEELEPPPIGGGVELEVQLLCRSPRDTPTPGAGARPGLTAPSHPRGGPVSPCKEWAAGAPPHARAAAVPWRQNRRWAWSGLRKVVVLRPESQTSPPIPQQGR